MSNTKGEKKKETVRSKFTEFYLERRGRMTQIESKKKEAMRWSAIEEEETIAASRHLRREGGKRV